jgi:hypothetical protein
MTDEQLAAMHRLLAEHHRKLAKEAALDEMGPGTESRIYRPTSNP